MSGGPGAWLRLSFAFELREFTLILRGVAIDIFLARERLNGAHDLFGELAQRFAVLLTTNVIGGVNRLAYAHANLYPRRHPLTHRLGDIGADHGHRDDGRSGFDREPSDASLTA